jgi:hypothetical protein
MSISADYVSATTFTVDGDQTSLFLTDRSVKADCGVDGIKYGIISTTSTGVDNTSVVLTASSDNLTANLTEVWYGVDASGYGGALPVHDHSGDLGAGGATLSGVVIIAAAHTTVSGAQVVNVVYGTEDPPTISGVPNGTLYIVYEV